MTELFKKWKEAKNLYKERVIIFRAKNGVYDSYMEDAERIAGVASLEMRTDGDVKITEFGHHELDVVLPALIHAGLKVAICEPISE